MKTAIIGAGAIGSLFTALIKANNFDTVIYDTDSKKIADINKNGLYLEYPETDKKLLTSPDATDNIKNIKDADFYLLCVKSYSTDAAAKMISEICSKNSVIITFQNGMGNVDILKKYFPDNRIAAGTTSEGATFILPSTVLYGGKGKTSFSIIAEKSDNSILDPLIQMLNKSGLETSLTDNYKKDIWRKLVINAAINPLTSSLNLKNSYVSELPYLHTIADMIIEEAVRTAEKEGIFLEIDEIRETVYSVAEKTGSNKSSMLQDIENRRKTEIDYISGAIAEKSDFSPSVNRIMQNIIKVLSR